MPLTTGGPPGAGIYWYAAIFSSFTATAAAAGTMRNIPRGVFDSRATANVGMRPPQKFTARVTAFAGMTVGTEETTAFKAVATASSRMGQTPNASFKTTATAGVRMVGHVGAPEPAPGQLNVAVSRAATI